MKLTVVGCSGSFPSADSACSSYLLEAEGFRLVMDLGNGALGALQRHIGLYDVDAVCFSHLHADHCVDLCAYWVARNYRFEGCPARIPVYGPEGTSARLARVYDMPDQPGMHEAFDFRRLRPGVFEVGPFRITADRVAHPVEAYAFRVEYGGRSLVYSGDTGPCDALAKLSAGADLLLAEASFTHGREEIPDLHLNGRQAGEYAARGAVGRLVLTHIPPWTDRQRNLADASEVFAGPTGLARPGDVYFL
ncbi:MBL fold metallo-hydrolase [Allostreptomyces psammosilenae]|uniref:Ribonuclease BN (tRNA processing enzyme) n=1 Tax=Allostreptomyces psammosilenae TaxID=1892865 RepID=A0A853A0R0_9ACTN|nr:MBL fold metallo-hydrolase [Allostreptomyces psammosilenae]NYI08156.1 ribonuclease BN (tRNA processing enzyme) [Allostreptomyces psammosilenae]